MKKYREVFVNNRKWAEDMIKNDPDFFNKLSTGQNPDFLWIGCSDSRVPANVVMGLDPGDVFVHRNVANIVVNTDLNVMSVAKYAVDNLKVKHVVVCGHYGCGGVKAAMQSADLGLLNGWLREVRDVYRLHRDELNAITDEEDRYNRLVELNVQEQAVNLIKTAFIQKAYRDTGYPIVHGWVYDIKTGLLKDLELDFDAILTNIREIYNLDS